MVLHHIPQSPRCLVIFSPVLDSKRFQSIYLHVIHVVPIPQGLEYLVCETQNQYILYRLLSQEVVYTINFLFTEYLQQGLIQLFRSLQTRPERFLHHNPVPATPFLNTKQATSPDIFRDCLLRIRRGCQIIHHPHRDGISLHQKHHPLSQLIGSFHGIKRLVVHFL